MRYRYRGTSLLPVIVLAAVCSAQTDFHTSDAGETNAVDMGRKLFLVSCAPCHGNNGEGGAGQLQGTRVPDLTRGTFKAGNLDEDLIRVIVKGIPASGMPSFEQLGPVKIRNLVQFVRSLSRSDRVPAGNAASGSATAGEGLFWGKGDCGRCHAIGARGVSLGPDLSRGSRRGSFNQSAADRLRMSIVSPEEDITQGYEMVVIETRDHKTVRGLSRYFDNFSARIIDSSGNERTYLRDEVISMKQEMRSVMPLNYGQMFTRAELDDLVAFIMKIRAESSLP